MPEVSYWKVLTRRKTITIDAEGETKLNRVLGTYDLTALGVGATLGVGVYVLAGHVAKDQAGPSVVISFLIAAMASLLAGLCYAEFGARVPKAGSAYIYSYVCIGELAAFVIGWNLILEYIIGSASVCRGISLYLDTLLNDTLKNTFADIAPIEWGFLASYFDFLACAMAVTFGVCLAFGIQTSTVLNNFCTILNIGVVIFVIIAGAINANIHNWEINPAEVNTTAFEKPPKLGVGGFFPFGFEGTLRGAATCFFGFVGFDCIATTGEEVRDPRRAIPRSILFSLLIIFLSYFGVSTVLTLMWPYYLQDVDAPLPYAFGKIGWPIAKWIVTIGGMIGLVASLFGAMFPLPRIIYAMSQDGLVFRFLGTINSRFKTPVIGSVCAAFLTGIIAGLFDLTQLVNMLSIGTLMAYTVVAISITILRFMDNSNKPKSSVSSKFDLSENSILMSSNSQDKTNCHTVMMQLFNFKRLNIPSDLSTRIVCSMLMVYCLSCLGFSLTVMYARTEILTGVPWSIALLAIFAILNIILTLAISVQPREERNPYFKVPLVPLVPAISIFVNIYLMLQLDVYTWIRFGIWMAIGFPIYLSCICVYGRNSNYNRNLANTYYRNGLVNDGFYPDDSHIIKSNGKISMVMSSDGEMMERKTPSPKSSLDEIYLVSEMGDSMKEMRQNGKTFFVPNDETGGKRSDEGSDASTAIAILDNVLQDEESGIHDYTRKTSVDSEMIPSSYDISTAAMIHSSSLKEEEENISSGLSDDSVELEAIERGKSLKFEIDDVNDKSSMSAVNVSLVGDKMNEFSDKSEDVAENLESEEASLPVTTLQLTISRKNSGSEKEEHELLPTITLQPTVSGLDRKEDETLPVSTLQPTISHENSASEKGEDASLPIIMLPPTILRKRSETEELELNEIAIGKRLNEDGTENSCLSSKEERIGSRLNSEVVEKILTNINKENTNKDSPEKMDTDEKSIETQLTSRPNSFTQIQPTPSQEPTDAQKPLNKVNITLIPLKSSSPGLSRKSSVTSNSSYEDPVHSENFKAKLIRLMTRPPPLKLGNKKDDATPIEESPPPIPKTAPPEVPPSLLKLSKSEADIRQLVLKAIEGLNEDQEPTIPDKIDGITTIPKAPKFDPILYKSLGARTFHQAKQRPKLDELAGNEIEHTKKALKTPTISPKKEEDSKEEKEDLNPLPFKEKLAALLKRGPSHKIQRQLPPDQSPRPSSEFKENSKNNYRDVVKAIRDAKRIRRDSENSQNNRKNSVELEEVGKSLRPLA